MCPIRDFRVGSALLADDGRISPAATSRTPPIRPGPAPRPGRSRPWRLRRAGHPGDLVIGDGAGLCTPCGICRQRIREFALAGDACACRGAGRLRRSFTLGELLPASFGPDNLDIMTSEDRQKQARAEAAGAVAALRARASRVPSTRHRARHGLGPLADEIEDAVRVLCGDSGFPAGNVSGHAKELVAGRLSGRRVVAYNGRSHYYERGDRRTVMRIPWRRLSGSAAGRRCSPKRRARCTRNWGPAACR